MECRPPPWLAGKSHEITAFNTLSEFREKQAAWLIHTRYRGLIIYAVEADFYNYLLPGERSVLRLVSETCRGQQASLD